MFNIILASKSKVREEILKKNNINCQVVPSNIDEDVIKKSLQKETIKSHSSSTQITLFNF